MAAKPVQNGWVALLRGINLGPRNRVAMADLRRTFEAAGCTSVQTYIQSGNVVFRHAGSDREALAAGLERAVKKELNVSAAIVLRTFAELAKVARAHPFGQDNSHTVVTFLAEKPSPAAVRSLAKLEIGEDRYRVVGQDAFLHYPNGFQGARLTGALLERRLGVPGTARNWRTVLKLAELAESAGR